MPHEIAQIQDAPVRVFNDSLALRAKQIRYRGAGNPLAFLDGIGVIPIKEFLYRGYNIIDVADVLNLPLTIIHRWIDFNNLQDELADASVISAEGYIYKGEQLLESATTKFELDKAKAMLDHGRFMASKKDKRQYGNTPDEKGPQGGVTYVFNIGKEDAAKDFNVPEAIDGEFKEVGPPSLSMEFNIGQEKPAHLGETKTKIEAVEPEQSEEKLTAKDKWEF